MRIGVIILAAGSSSRFGTPKQLAEFRGQTLIRRAIDAAVEFVGEPVVVVLGANADEIQKHVPSSVRIVRNENWASGMGSSIRAGVAAIESDVDAVILMLCDQPMVGADTLRRLAAGAKRGLVASEYNGTIGVPALFSREYFEELKTLPDKEGAKKVLERYASRVDRMRCLEAGLDIDTVEDLMKFVGERVKGG